MCLKPDHVWIKRGPNWVQTPKPCGDCWRCRRNYLNDYVGRSLCEASVSEATVCLTLTYADRDDLAEKMITPRHFQLFIKLLRNAGHKVRYLAIGEYGSLKGRAHFHVILFFKRLVPLQFRTPEGKLITRGQTPRYKDDYLPGTLPEHWGPFCREIPQERMVHIREWPHGHIQADWAGDEKAIRYVCKYLLAENKQKDTYWFSPSKYPPLGWEWFARKAAKARELGVLPSSFEYLPLGGRKDRVYLMTGATRRDFLAACGPVSADRPHMSEWVQRTYDKYERARRLKELEVAETLRSQTEGFVVPEPDVDDIEFDDWRYDREYYDWWLEHSRDFPDHPYDGKFPHSVWSPPGNSGYGKETPRPAFFDEDRVYNPKPRARAVSVSGHFPRQSRAADAGERAARSARREAVATAKARYREANGGGYIYDALTGEVVGELVTSFGDRETGASSPDDGRVEPPRRGSSEGGGQQDL